MNGVFVTGTGTEIGKTHVSCELIRQWRTRVEGPERLPRALKPVISGFDEHTPEGSDTALLLEAQGQRVTPETIAQTSPWRYRAPLSPDMAAAREGRRIDWPALCRFCATEGTQAPALVEGVGGVMVPLDEHRTVLDWIEATALPALLVAGTYLGTLSHTLTALSVLAARQIPVLGVVLTGPATGPVSDATLVATIKRHHATRVRVLPPAELDHRTPDLLELLPPGLWLGAMADPG